jgi:hypothetical protein
MTSKITILEASGKVKDDALNLGERSPRNCREQKGNKKLPKLKGQKKEQKLLQLS